MASMAEAAKIRDVAARHAYVFDNGLCSPDFFDVEKRMRSEEFGLLLEHCEPEHSILEVGCFTGLNLLGLANRGYKKLYGCDFVAGAVQWMREESQRRGMFIFQKAVEFPAKGDSVPLDRVICFDVLEHQLNIERFLLGVERSLLSRGKALFLVPAGRAFYDCGHVAFFPDEECLRNVLDYFFEVEEIRRLESCEKLFAACRRRD